jgi:hypothetical protein
VTSDRARIVLALLAVGAGAPLVVIPLAGKGNQQALLLGLAGLSLLLAAITIERRLLPAAVACWAVELVLLHTSGETPSWSVPPLATTLVLVYEAAERRELTPRQAHVEPGAVATLARGLLATLALALAASTVVLVAASAPGRPGPASGIVGLLAVTLLLGAIATTAHHNRTRRDRSEMTQDPGPVPATRPRARG